MNDATALAQAISARHTTSSEAMLASLDAAETYKDLGAISHLDAKRGLESAKGSDHNEARQGVFNGVPFLVKNLGGPFAGWPVTAASRALKADGYADSDLAARIRATGVCIFGITTVPEFGLSLATEPELGPTSANPLAPTLGSGGSSGGSAAAVAAGIVSIAHATDAGGSIRVPAACCGLIGLKPGRGVVPGGPHFTNHLGGIASELAVCRSVRDARAMFNSVSQVANDPGSQEWVNALPEQLRIGVLANTGNGYPTQDDQLDVVEAAAISLMGDGHLRQDVDWATIEPIAAKSAGVFAAIVSVNLAAVFEANSLDASKTELLTQAAIEKGRKLNSTDLWVQLNSAVHVSYQLWQVFENVDCLITPMLSSQPRPLGAFPTDHHNIDAHFDRMTEFSPTATLANISGFPAISVPFGRDRDDLPLAIQIIAPPGREELLLSMAERLESEQRWQHRFPVAGLSS